MARFGIRTQSVFVYAALLLASVLLQGCASGSVSSGTNPTPQIIVSVMPPTASVETGKTQAITAQVMNDTSNRGVTWTMSGTGCTGAACGMLTNMTATSATYAAPATVTATTKVTVTATSATDPAKNSSMVITVTAPATISVTVSPGAYSLMVSQSTTFLATLTNDTQNKGVSWSLSGAGCSGATCGTLSGATTSAVTYTAPASVPSPATVTLKATSIADVTKSMSAAITVTAQVGVSVSPPTASVNVGKTKQFNATVNNDPQSKGVTWSVSGTGCSGAACGTISASGLYTGPGSVPSPATVTVTATSVADPTRQGTATVTVLPAIAVSVSPASPTVLAGAAQPFTASVSNDAQNLGVTWGLSGAGCSGVTCGVLSGATTSAVTYTAPAIVPSPATVTLTATSIADGAKNGLATITVSSSSLPISVTVSPKRAGLTIGQTLPVSATVLNDTLSKGVTWTATGGTFSQTNSLSGANVTYTAPGTAGVYTVTATSVADGSKTGSFDVGVTDLPGVTTYHNDLSRDGVNASEYALNSSTVTTATFGKLFSCTVDGAVYAQPLWVANLTVGSVKHNVIFVATQHDGLYAFDADANPCVMLWHVNLLDSAHGGTPGETSVPSGPGGLVGSGSGDISPEVGVTGTPVIDAATNTLYVVSKSVIASGPTFFQRLHAIDLVSGNEKLGGHVTISASVPGTGDGSSGGNVAFRAREENQRAGLALVNGVVYIAWASHEDTPPYHGWVIGYDKTTLAQVSAFNANPNGSDAGIWMSGGAPAADISNNLYVITGNGTFDANSATAPNTDYGDSFLKLSTAPALSVASYFTPSNQSTLSGGDLDLGAGGATVLVDAPSAPAPRLVIGGGKEGKLFLLNRDALGGYGANFSPADSNAVQIISTGTAIFSTPAFWQNSLYVGGVGGHLTQYAFNPATGKFTTPPFSQSPGTFGFPGTTPSVSSMGSTNGIVWALNNNSYCTNQSPGCGAAELHAYDATNLATEYWNSTTGTGNAAGNAVKFTVPTVANGKVYVGTRGNDTGSGGTSRSGELDVYGLLAN